MRKKNPFPKWMLELWLLWEVTHRGEEEEA